MPTKNDNPGHLNTRRRDHDSYVTAYGSHDRVVAFEPSSEGLYMRVDHKWQLGMPSIKQLLTVKSMLSGLSGGPWVLDRIDPWSDGTATDIFFTSKKVSVMRKKRN